MLSSLVLSVALSVISASGDDDRGSGRVAAVEVAPGCKIIGWRPDKDGNPIPIIDCQG